MLLVVKVSCDKQHIETVAHELHRARSWAYKWYKRYGDEGLDSSKDRQKRSGRPSLISNEVKKKIRLELSDSNTGWNIKEVMDLIQKKSGIRYYKEHIRRLLHQWGFSLKAPKKRFVKGSPEEQRKDFKKG